MKRTISVKLLHTAEQAQAFGDLAETFSDSCNHIVPLVQENRCFNRVALHHLAYYSVRETFPDLGSQMVCKAVHRVTDAYKTLQSNKRIKKGEPIPLIQFSPKSVHFDKRTYSIKDDSLSLFTMGGRVKVPFVMGKHQQNLFDQGSATEAELICKKGQWFFNLVLDIPDVDSATGDKE